MYTMWHLLCIYTLDMTTCYVLSSEADLEGGVRGMRGVHPPKIRKAYVIQR